MLQVISQQLPLQEYRPWHNLAADVLTILFRKLAVRDLFVCGYVCKRWRKISLNQLLWNNRDAEIVETHLKYHTCQIIQLAEGVFSSPTLQVESDALYFKPNAGDLWVFNRHTNVCVQKFDHSSRYYLDKNKVLEITSGGQQRRSYIHDFSKPGKNNWDRLDLVIKYGDYCLNHFAIWRDFYFFVYDKKYIFKCALANREALILYSTLNRELSSSETLEVRDDLLIVTGNVNFAKAYTIFDLKRDVRLFHDLQAMDVSIFTIKKRKLLWFNDEFPSAFDFESDAILAVHWIGRVFLDSISSKLYEKILCNGILHCHTLRIENDGLHRDTESYVFEDRYKTALEFDKLEIWGSYFFISNLIVGKENATPLSGIWKITSTREENRNIIQLVYLVTMETTYLHEGVFYTADNGEFKAYSFTRPTLKELPQQSSSKCIIS